MKQASTFYTESHQWIQVEEKKGAVGITPYAKEQLGEVVFLELPQIGQKVEAGESVAIVESTKAAFDLYAPVSGVIEEVHEAVAKDLSLLGQPDTWLFSIALSDEKELGALLDRAAYEEMTLGRSSR